MTYREDIKNRVRKLLRLAEDDAATEGEIDNALRMARRLMIKHQFDQKDVAADDADRFAGFHNVRTYTIGRGLTLWEHNLAFVFVDLIGTVRCLYGKGMIDIIGPRDDADLVGDLFRDFADNISHQARLKWGGAVRGDGRCYCEGFVQAMCESLQRIQAAERIQVEAHTPTGAFVERALVVMADKRDEVDEFLDSLGFHRRRHQMKGQRKVWNRGAYDDGQAEGEQVDLKASVESARRQ